MNRMVNTLGVGRWTERSAFAAILYSVSAVAPAHAYIDPGTGSMVLQLLLGGVAGAMVNGRLYMQRIADAFRAITGRKPAEDAPKADR
jgi:hypothetical protein